MHSDIFDPASIKKDFPLLMHQENENLVYLDNAATSQKPQCVLDALTDYYVHSTSNVHRGVHALSDASTSAWENARLTIARFFGAQEEELILTRNTTEAINGFVYGWADQHLKPGDTILVTQMEHHANFVPWQQAAKRTGATFLVCPVLKDGTLDMHAFESLLNPTVKVVSFVHVSNTLGTINPVKTIATMVASKAPDALLVLDAAQSAPHMPLSFADLGVDVLAASGHKMLGPMGAGVLLVKKSLLDKEIVKPWLFGGGMIAAVTEQSTRFHPEPAERFTAGTPDVASAVGLAAACTYLSDLGMEVVEAHDKALVTYALEKLQNRSDVTLVGPTDPAKRLGCVTFIHSSVHAHDVAQILDSEGVAVRSGHHCTMPLHTAFGWQATVRASFQVYTSYEDVDKLCIALDKVAQVFL